MPSRDQIGVLVDYGRGAGKSTRAVAGCAREGGKVVGVDVSTAMLDHARALTKKAASNLPKVSFEFLQIVDDSIPLPRASADAVMTCAVLQEIQTETQLGAIIAEIGRILKPGGQFVAIVPNEHLRLEDFVSVTFAPFPRTLLARIIFERTDRTRRPSSGRRIGFGPRKSTRPWSSKREWKSYPWSTLSPTRPSRPIQISLKFSGKTS
jgi:ubiquinone/menaquinone biosynthesis C-methylase UbiE